MFPSSSPGAISCGPKVNTTRPFVLQTIPLYNGEMVPRLCCPLYLLSTEDGLPASEGGRAAVKGICGGTAGFVSGSLPAPPPSGDSSIPLGFQIV